jgi:hypothetical protein
MAASSPEAAQQVLVAVVLDLGQEALFDLLDRARREHDGDAQHECDQRGVEGDGQAAGDRADRLLHDLEVDGAPDRLGEAAHGGPDADHRADEAEDRNRPDEHAHHRVARLDGVGVGIRLVLELRLELARIASRLEVLESASDALQQQPAAARSQRGQVLDEVPGVVGRDARADACRQQLELEGVPLARQAPQLLDQHHAGPGRQEGDDVGHPAPVPEEVAEARAEQGLNHGQVEEGGDAECHGARDDQARIGGTSVDVPVYRPAAAGVGRGGRGGPDGYNRATPLPAPGKPEQEVPWRETRTKCASG